MSHLEKPLPDDLATTIRNIRKVREAIEAGFAMRPHEPPDPDKARANIRAIRAPRLRLVSVNGDPYDGPPAAA